MIVVFSDLWLSVEDKVCSHSGYLHICPIILCRAIFKNLFAKLKCVMVFKEKIFSENTGFLDCFSNWVKSLEIFHTAVLSIELVIPNEFLACHLQLPALSSSYFTCSLWSHKEQTGKIITSFFISKSSHHSSD